MMSELLLETNRIQDRKENNINLIRYDSELGVRLVLRAASNSARR